VNDRKCTVVNYATYSVCVMCMCVCVCVMCMSHCWCKCNMAKLFYLYILLHPVPLHLRHLIGDKGRNHTLPVLLEDVVRGDQFHHHLQGVLSRIKEEGTVIVYSVCIVIHTQDELMSALMWLLMLYLLGEQRFLSLEQWYG